MQRVAIAEPMRVEVTAVAVLTLAACTHVRDVPPDPAALVPRDVVEVDRWQVQVEGEDLGFLVLIEIRDPSGPIRYYRVENSGRQWVGHVALDGWFTRRVPFQEEEERLGMYTMSRGLALLYQVDDTVQLTPVEGGASEASIPRRGR